MPQGHQRRLSRKRRVVRCKGAGFLFRGSGWGVCPSCWLLAFFIIIFLLSFFFCFLLVCSGHRVPLGTLTIWHVRGHPCVGILGRRPCYNPPLFVYLSQKEKFCQISCIVRLKMLYFPGASCMTRLKLLYFPGNLCIT